MFPILKFSLPALKPFYYYPTLISFQAVYFSKYISKSRTKRLPLNTKRVGKGYKKGYGARKEGFNTRRGINRFQLWSKFPNLLFQVDLLLWRICE